MFIQSKSIQNYWQFSAILSAIMDLNVARSAFSVSVWARWRFRIANSSNLFASALDSCTLKKFFCCSKASCSAAVAVRFNVHSLHLTSQEIAVKFTNIFHQLKAFSRDGSTQHHDRQISRFKYCHYTFMKMLAFINKFITFRQGVSKYLH